jgi:redox-sensitive bicupin YhaK (pirin superfamily)
LVIKLKCLYQYNNTKGSDQIIYVLSDELKTNDDSLLSGQALLVNHKNQLKLKTTSASPFIVLSGKPIGGVYLPA